VDDALELLTGMPAKTLHEAVAGKLAEYSQTLKALAAGAGSEPRI
jgi:hypothetical protein